MKTYEPLFSRSGFDPSTHYKLDAWTLKLHKRSLGSEITNLRDYGVILKGDWYGTKVVT